MKRTLQENKNGRKERAVRLKFAVMALLKCNEEQFATFQYEQGIAYLKSLASGLPADDGQFMNAMERSRTFWSWWRNQWTNADECFIPCAYDLDRMQRAQVYYELHDGRILSGKIFPNRIVMKDAELITQ